MFNILNNPPPLEEFVTPNHGIDVPSIYAIEATAACDLQCPMCFRTTSQLPGKKPGLFNLSLLDLMLDRGDFSGSSYIELQMAGEPTIHPHLGYIIQFLQERAGVMVGLSTHGHNFKKPYKHDFTVGEMLMGLDALTVSVDSLNPTIYHQMRYPKHLPALLANLDYLFELVTQATSPPLVELQLVKATNVPGSGDLDALKELIHRKKWEGVFHPRMIGDSFTEMRGDVEEGSLPRSADVCLNPFTSVNITQDGKVVSCCYAFHDEPFNTYGDLWKNSLSEIWKGAAVSEMRETQILGNAQGLCAKCPMPSPIFIHQRIVSRLVRRLKCRP